MMSRSLFLSVRGWVCVACVVAAAACATGKIAGGDDVSDLDSSTPDSTMSGCPQFDLQNDPKHCGSCTNACMSGQVCSNGMCKAQCDSPLVKCLNVDGGTEAGVCFDVTSDINHCGQCTTACTTADAGALEAGNSGNPDAGIPPPDGGFPTGPFVSTGTASCSKSMCALTCPMSMTKCTDGLCYDTQDFHDRCGDCNTACAADVEWCTQGHCCATGSQYCGSACTDVTSDSSNCGACGVTCSGGTPVCSAGKCASAITYTDSFTSGGTPTTQCTDWNTFRAKLTGTYTSVTLKGSQDTTGRTCTGATANTLCQALRTNTAVGPTTCSGYSWEVYTSCGGASPELSADGTGCTCTASPNGYDVRPCIANLNWGGIKGASCSAPTQTITVSCQ